MPSIIRLHAPKKKPKKPTAVQRQEAAEWERLNAKWMNVPKFSSSTPKKRSEVTTPLDPKVPEDRRVTDKLKSRVTPGASTSKPPDKVYTGTAVLGIATMHKSNQIPIFSSEEAIDVAKMRR